MDVHSNCFQKISNKELIRVYYKTEYTLVTSFEQLKHTHACENTHTCTTHRHTVTHHMVSVMAHWHTPHLSLVTLYPIDAQVMTYCMHEHINNVTETHTARTTCTHRHIHQRTDRYTGNVMTCSNLSPSQHFTTWSLPAENTKWVPGTNYNNTDMITPPPSLLPTCTAITLSSWANIDLWQSPKSNPHNLMFLSADPVTSKVLSCQWNSNKCDL